MDPLVVALRLVHVVLGGLWVGMAVFTTFLLMPAIQETGPDGGKVAAALQRRGLMTVMPILAILTIISGIWLYWRASGGFQPGYAGSPMGIAFGVGGTAAIVAYALGIAIMRPAMIRSTELMEGMASAPEGERAQRMAEIQRLRARGASMGRVVAVLLLVALAAMGVARYI